MFSRALLNDKLSLASLSCDPLLHHLISPTGSHCSSTIVMLSISPRDDERNNRQPLGNPETARITGREFPSAGSKTMPCCLKNASVAAFAGAGRHVVLQRESCAPIFSNERESVQLGRVEQRFSERPWRFVEVWFALRESDNSEPIATRQRESHRQVHIASILKCTNSCSTKC